jgi:hypothetical protein
MQTIARTDSSSFALQNSLVAGLSVGAGIEITAGRLHIAREMRYTHWLAPNFSAAYSLGGKQIEFFLGFRF